MKKRRTIGMMFIVALSYAMICWNVADGESFEQMEARYNGHWSHPDNLLASNIYTQVRSVYAHDNWRALYDYFCTVRGGGVQLYL